MSAPTFGAAPLPEGTDVLWGEGGMNNNGVVPGLRADNGWLAEIHYILRTHGNTIAGSTAEQISLLHGGCPLTSAAINRRPDFLRP